MTQRFSHRANRPPGEFFFPATPREKVGFCGTCGKLSIFIVCVSNSYTILEVGVYATRRPAAVLVLHE